MNKKLINQRIHAKKRAFERYGLTLNRNDLQDIVNNIHKAKLLSKTSNRVKVFEVLVKGVSCVVVYDRNRKSIATFLPLDCWENHVEQNDCDVSDEETLETCKETRDASNPYNACGND